MKFPAIFAIASLGTALVVLTLANYPGLTPPASAGQTSVQARSLVEKLRDNVKETFRRL